MIAATLATATVLAAGPPASNETVLSARRSQKLVTYAASMRNCLVRDGVRVGGLRVTRKLIDFAVLDGRTQRELVRRGLACARVVGDPPRDASLQTFPGRVVLYVPKQCLLDPNVAQAGPRSSSIS